MPFEGENLHLLMQNIEKNQYFINRITYPEFPPISSELRTLLTKLLDKNPETRITIQQLLQDPWLNA